MSEENNLGQNSTDKGEAKKARTKILWPELNTPEWISAIATVAAAIAAVAAVVVSLQTRIILQGQLDQMVSGSTATDRMIELQSQLNAAAGFQGAVTDKLARYTEEMSGSTATLANAARGQLREMRDEQRPIVDVATIENATPLQTDPVIGAFIKFNVVNSGKSVAILAYPHAKLILNTADSEVLKKTKEACYASVRGPDGTTPIGFNLRVGVTIPMAAGYVLTPEETATWKARPDLRMLLVGCIGYMFDRRHHHAPFVQEVDRKDATAPEGWPPINPNKDKVDTGGLVFLTPPWYSPEPD